MKVAGLALALACLAGCRPTARYEIPESFLRVEDDARFTSAIALEPGQVVFSFTAGAYRYVDADPNQARGRREYVGGRKVLGLYDVARAETRVVRTEQFYGTGDGNGDDQVVDARGQAALLLRGRRTTEGVLINAGGWRLCDLATGALEAFDPRAELALFGLAPSSDPVLVDGAGTLLYAALPGPEAAAGAGAPHILVRRRGGALDDLGEGRFLGELAGRVYVERPGRDGAEAVDIATGARETLSAEALAALAADLRAPRTAALVRLSRTGDAVLYAAGAGAGPEPLPIDVAALRG